MSHLSLSVNTDSDYDSYSFSTYSIALIAFPIHLVYQSLVLLVLLAFLLLITANVPHIHYTLSNAKPAVLPYSDQPLGLNDIPDLIPSVPRYHSSWPTHIARINQKLKNAVYGDGIQVHISVEDSTIMQFPISPVDTGSGSIVCALTWTPPPFHSARNRELETKGDISKIEAQLVIITPGSDIDFDSLSWNTRPVRGKPLGTFDLTTRPNSSTVEFICPRHYVLAVEFRCPRVACYVRFEQVRMIPKMGFELLTRQI